VTFPFREHRRIGEQGGGLNQQLDVVLVGVFREHFGGLHDDSQVALQSADIGRDAEQALEIFVPEHAEGGGPGAEGGDAVLGNFVECGTAIFAEVLEGVPGGAGDEIYGAGG